MLLRLEAASASLRVRREMGIVIYNKASDATRIGCISPAYLYHIALDTGRLCAGHATRRKRASRPNLAGFNVNYHVTLISLFVRTD